MSGSFHANLNFSGPVVYKTTESSDQKTSPISVWQQQVKTKQLLIYEYEYKLFKFPFRQNWATINNTKSWKTNMFPETGLQFQNMLQIYKLCTAWYRGESTS
jgi:hypothetical protein